MFPKLPDEPAQLAIRHRIEALESRRVRLRAALIEPTCAETERLDAELTVLQHEIRRLEMRRDELEVKPRRWVLPLRR